MKSSSVNIKALTRGILECDNKVWQTASDTPISYPESGNADCLQIEEMSYWFQHRNDVLRTLLQTHTSKTESAFFVDIGGGNGFQANAIQKMGIETILIEPGLTGCINARDRGVDYVLNCTLENSGILDCSIPMAGAFDVVEHIENDAIFLNTVFQKLKINGLFYMTVPAIQSLWSEEDTYAGHFRRYSLKTATGALLKAGFEIEFASYFFRPLVLPIFLLRAVPYRLGMRNAVSLDTTAREHTLPDSIAGNWIKNGLARELRKLSRNKPQRTGTSIVIVGRKPAT